MNNWTDFDETGALLIAVLVIGGTIALYILSAIKPGEIVVPNELKAVAAVVMAAYGYKVKQGTKKIGEKSENAAKTQ